MKRQEWINGLRDDRVFMDSKSFYGFKSGQKFKDKGGNNYILKYVRRDPDDPAGQKTKEWTLISVSNGRGMNFNIEHHNRDHFIKNYETI